MTPLGLGAEHCREALERYREGVASLVALINAPQKAGPASDTLVAYDDLISRLAVDSLARRGPRGIQRMSQVEAELFAPAVASIHRDLEQLAHERPSPKWLPTLQAIDRRLEEVEHDIERWHRQVGVD